MTTQPYSEKPTSDGQHIEVERLLAQQADAMRAGQRLDDDALSALSREDKALFGLAESLKAALVPVEPDAVFLSRLKHELVGEIVHVPTPVWLMRWRQLPTGYRIAASLGGLTLAAGLTLLGVRRVMDVIGKEDGLDGESTLSLNAAS